MELGHQCMCSTCRMFGRAEPPLNDPAEIYVWCRSCGLPVQAVLGDHCGLCGLEVADKAPDHFYHESA